MAGETDRPRREGAGSFVRGRVSIVLTSFHSLPWLAPCFASLSRQTYADVEVVFVDNHSLDGSVEFVRAHYPRTIVVENPRDEGFASGNNIGVRHAGGEYLILLNTDTTVTETFVEDLLRAFREIPRLGCVQPKLLFLHDPRKLDSCGSLFTMTGFLRHVGNQQDERTPAYNTSFPVLSVKGACMMFKRELLEKTGGLFDDDYYCYFEETDFCMRVWLAGYECWYYPQAVIHHAMGGSTGRHIRHAVTDYHSFKNRLATYLKNLSGGTLARVLPAYALLNVLASIAFVATFRVRNAAAVYRALWYNVQRFPATLRKRSLVQRRIRRVSDRAFLPRVTGRYALRQILRYVVYLFTYEFLKYQPGEVTSGSSSRRRVLL